MLTSDIARELLEQRYQVEVEYLNRKFANGITARRTGKPRKKLGSKRTDVAVFHDAFSPSAIIEVKIGVKTSRAIKSDLGKITDTIDGLKPQYASRVWGAAVFQVHIPGSEDRYERAHFEAAIRNTENKIKKGISDHGRQNSGYTFAFHALQSESEGYMARAVEPDGDSDEYAWGEHGHATRYYAVLIKSKKKKPRLPKTVFELKKYSHS
jgi:hypothetical protein